MSVLNKKLYKVLRPRERHWVGNGFFVSTMFSVHSEDYKYLSPFLLLDHASPKHFAPTQQKLGVGEHPHRGFETVTFAIQGEVDHRDSGGGGGRITTGGVQWMTAGSGVVHEEFHSRGFAERGGVFEMVQLWVNLPAKDKMTSPRYQSMNKEDFPVQSLSSGQAELKLISGDYGEDQGPALTHTPICMFEVFVKESHSLSLQLKEGTNTLVVQLSGRSQVDGQTVEQGHVAIFNREGQNIQLDVEEGAHLLVLNGEPIDEPVASYGPFVMNTKSEIHQAIKDYEAGKMGQLVKESVAVKGE